MKLRLLALLLVLTFPLHAQTKNWRTYLPNKFIYDCLTAGNYLYAVNGNALIKYDLTTDNYSDYTKTLTAVPFGAKTNLAKDNQDNIWFFTASSLVKFDGTDFTQYPFPEGDLLANRIAVDNSNNVWIASDLGLVKFDGNNFQVLNPDTLTQYSGYFNTVAVSPGGDVWTSSYAYIARYNGNTWRVFKNEVQGFWSLCLFVDNNNVLWAGGLDGFYTYDGTNWLHNDGGQLIQDEIEAITAGSDGKIWFGTRLGVSVYDGTYYTNYGRFNSPLPNVAIQAVSPGEDGSVYISTHNGVVKFYNGNWKYYTFSPYNFSYDEVHQAVVDNYGQLWIAGQVNYGVESGYYPAALQYFSNNSMNILNLDSQIRRIYRIYIDKQNTKWITTSSGLFKVNDEGTILFDPDNSGIPSTAVYSSVMDNAGNLWIGTLRGLTEFDGTNWTVYDTTNSGLPDNFVTQVSVDRYQNIWAATGKGLTKFNGTDWYVYNKNNSGLRDNQVYCFAIDNKNELWISYNFGLTHYDGNRWENFDHSNSPLITDYIADMKIDKYNNLWLTDYMGGVIKKNADGWTVYNTENSPLTDNNVHSLFIDKNNNIIIGTNSGLNLLNESGINLVYPPEPQNLAEYFSLTQNYPNPFNNTTKIVYKVGVESYVQIKVYNILGKEIRTLVNENKVPGHYTIEFNGEGLSSGVYIYRMQVGGFVQTRKAILLK